MSKFLVGFWLPVLVLLLINKPAFAALWVLLPVVAIPAWFLCALFAKR